MLTALMALALGSSVAQGDGTADLHCILNRIPPAERLAIAAETLRSSGTGGPSSRSVEAAATTCAEQGRWPADYAGAMTGLAVAVLLGQQARLQLTEAGIQTSVVDAWFDALPVAERNRVLNDEALLDRLFTRLQAAGTAIGNIESNAEVLGLYLGSLSALDRMERGVPL